MSKSSNDKLIIIGMGTCGLASGSRGVLSQVEEELASLKLEVPILKTGCIGMCYQEVLVDVSLPGRSRVTYAKVEPEMVSKIISNHVVKGKPVKDYAIGQIVQDGEKTYKGIPTYDELDFFAKQ